MESLTGIKLISAATVFGAAAVIFTSVPFLLVILRGIVKSHDHSTGGANFLGVVIISFVIHAVSTISFMATIFVLDIFNKTSPHFFSSKIFGIFWAKDQSAVFSLAGITDANANEALGAYTTLLTVKTVAGLLYTCLPIVVILGALAYGIGLSTKDTYRQDYLTVIIYSGISMLCAMILYTAWALIASQGLFMSGEYSNLLNFISKTWEAMLLDAH